MTPREIERISVKVSSETKRILIEESAKAALSQTEYLERLIEGTLPDRVSANMKTILAEIESLRKEIKK